MTQTPPPSPLASPAPWDLVADAYTAEIVPFFEAFAREALRLAGVAPGMRVVDVAAGPGTLSLLAAKAGARVSALDFAPEMIARLRARVASEGVEGVEAAVGDGMALPFADASFDAGFSMFGLMFFPDRARGFAELSRVLAPGAQAVVSSWVSFERIPMLAATFSILGELVPSPGPPPRGFPLVDPADCRAEMSAGGFTEVAVHEFAATMEVPSTADLVASMARTNAPIVLMRRKLGDAWEGVAARLLERLVERFGPGPHRVSMPANLIVGRRGR